MVVIVFGLPGSGKTFFAKALAKELGAEHFNTDIIRREVVAAPTYREEEKDLIYHTLLSKIVDGKNIILDGTFYKHSLRQECMNKAVAYGHKFFFIEIKADEEEIKNRTNKKRKDSDADFDIYLKMRNEFEEMKEEHLVLWSDKAQLKEMIMQALRHINKD